MKQTIKSFLMFLSVILTFFSFQLSLTLFYFTLKGQYAALIAALCTDMHKHIPSLLFFIKKKFHI